MAMMDDIAGGKDQISYVLVFKLSRFGRNAADVLKSIQTLLDYDVDLVCVEDSIDRSTQGGRLTLAILSAVAEIERENIRVQFMVGRMQKMMEGGWAGGPAPFVFLLILPRFFGGGNGRMVGYSYCRVAHFYDDDIFDI